MASNKSLCLIVSNRRECTHNKYQVDEVTLQQRKKILPHIAESGNGGYSLSTHRFMAKVKRNSKHVDLLGKMLPSPSVI